MNGDSIEITEELKSIKNAVQKYATKGCTLQKESFYNDFGTTIILLHTFGHIVN